MGEVSGRRREAGYNLVILVMAIAILNIMVAAMLPLWSTQIRREKEEELIFRGLQYAEAIRIFQIRFQRLPTTLKELRDVTPRSIRQLWKDPMTEDGEFAPIYQGQGTPLQPPTNPNNPQVPNEGGGGGQPNGEQPPTVAAGPIVGVHSRSTRESIETWNGQQEYDQWMFTYNLLNVKAGAPGGRPPLSARWIGRPFPGMTQLPGFQPVAGGPQPPVQTPQAPLK